MPLVVFLASTCSGAENPVRACVGQVCIDGIELEIAPEARYVKGKLHNGSPKTFERIHLTFRVGRNGAATGTATAIMPVPLGPGESWSFSALSLEPAAYTDSVTLSLEAREGKAHSAVRKNTGIVGHGATKTTVKFGPVWSPQADTEKRK